MLNIRFFLRLRKAILLSGTVHTLIPIPFLLKLHAVFPALGAKVLVGAEHNVTILDTGSVDTAGIHFGLMVKLKVIIIMDLGDDKFTAVLLNGWYFGLAGQESAAKLKELMKSAIGTSGFNEGTHG